MQLDRIKLYYFNYATRNIRVPSIVEDKEDAKKWKDVVGNLVDFSTKKVWEIFEQQNTEVKWKNVVWCPQCNPRYAFVLWMTIK